MKGIALSPAAALHSITEPIINGRQRRVYERWAQAPVDLKKASVISGPLLRDLPSHGDPGAWMMENPQPAMVGYIA
jgi:hypothetical protein